MIGCSHDYPQVLLNVYIFYKTVVSVGLCHLLNGKDFSFARIQGFFSLLQVSMSDSIHSACWNDFVTILKLSAYPSVYVSLMASGISYTYT